MSGPSVIQYRVSWEMPPPTFVALDCEDIFGPGVWPKLSPADWDALPWQLAVNVTDDLEGAVDQYRGLVEWADTHAQPIRNVRIERRTPPEWEEFTPDARSD